MRIFVLKRTVGCTSFRALFMFLALKRAVFVSVLIRTICYMFIARRRCNTVHEAFAGPGWDPKKKKKRIMEGNLIWMGYNRM